MIQGVLMAAVVLGVPIPTPDQLMWASDELTSIGHFNMGTFQSCGIGAMTLEGNAEEGASYIALPPASTFAPTNVSTDQWIQAIKSYGAKHAVLVVSHGCGFNTFPSNTAFPEFDFVYNYSIKHSPWKNGAGDIAREFVDSCHKYGIRPGFYHGAMNNAFLNVVGGKVQPNTIPGQAKITQDQYYQILLANLRQLWTNYGPLAEVWFDGGYPSDKGSEIASLLQELQPTAVAFGGPGKNVVRWCGTESGHLSYPYWSTASAVNDCTRGEPNGAVFVPAEADTCFQTGAGVSEKDRAPYGGCWFFNANMVPKSLSALVSTYHDTVGINANLLLDWTPDQTGTLLPAHVQRYQEFGSWLRACYDDAVVQVANKTGMFSVTVPQGAAFDRIVIKEDQTKGQLVRGYTVAINGKVEVTETAIGHKRIVLLGKYVQGPATVTFNVTLSAANEPTPVISSFGLHNCSQTPTPQGCAFTSNFAYNAPANIVISSTKGSTSSACCSSCRALSNCAVFTLSAAKTCVLLSANQGGDATQGALSGSPLR
eukprot:TRINITY_DN3427_c0_g1_i1.p1 TRINITY_DN3427_c0_g1~~TRINITY_DN3427_c0_g1_i1.p1  ORF type:complete len:560 (+),score=179.98 TRINITY_DN3427_c0_g1_i1:64-1680(+)